MLFLRIAAANPPRITFDSLSNQARNLQNFFTGVVLSRKPFFGRAILAIFWAILRKSIWSHWLSLGGGRSAVVHPDPPRRTRFSKQKQFSKSVSDDLNRQWLTIVSFGIGTAVSIFNPGAGAHQMLPIP